MPRVSLPPGRRSSISERVAAKAAAKLKKLRRNILESLDPKEFILQPDTAHFQTSLLPDDLDYELSLNLPRSASPVDIFLRFFNDALIAAISSRAQCADLRYSNGRSVDLSKKKIYQFLAVKIAIQGQFTLYIIAIYCSNTCIVVGRQRRPSESRRLKNPLEREIIKVKSLLEKRYVLCISNPSQMKLIRIYFQSSWCPPPWHLLSSTLDV